MLGQVIPGIEFETDSRVPPDRSRYGLNAATRFKFTTLMWFDNLGSVRAFMGEDYSVSHVPAAARAVLKRFDERAAHHAVLDRRMQQTKG